jgi:hypothetical protein
MLFGCTLMFAMPQDRVSQLLVYHSFSQRGCTTPVFFDTVIGTTSTTRFPGAIRPRRVLTSDHFGGRRLPCPRPHRRSPLSCSSRRATSAFRGAETRARRFIRRKTSCVLAFDPRASAIHRHFEQGRVKQTRVFFTASVA